MPLHENDTHSHSSLFLKSLSRFLLLNIYLRYLSLFHNEVNFVHIIDLITGYEYNWKFIAAAPPPPSEAAPISLCTFFACKQNMAMQTKLHRFSTSVSIMLSYLNKKQQYIIFRYQNDKGYFVQCTAFWTSM